MAKKVRLVRVSLVQALGVVGYCGLVGVVLWRGNQWFGRVSNYWGPFLFLVLFSASALVCMVLTLGYPAILIWKEKQPVKAIQLVGMTAGWLVVATLIVMAVVLISKAG